MEQTFTYKTHFGTGRLSWRNGRLIAVNLPEKSSSTTIQVTDVSIPNKEETAPNPSSEAASLIRKLEAYFSGKRFEFDIDSLPLDLSGHSPFALNVVRALAALPYGETITYGGLAEAAGHPGAARAVGNVMAANPFPVIIPCHRVIRSSGGIGGFSGGEGWKQTLLTLEFNQRDVPSF